MTIRDVAREAGVAISTVSHALSGKRPITADTRSRVRSAVDRLGYRPNSLARGLVTGQSSSLGLVVPDIANPFFSALVRAAEDVARQHGFSLILCSTDLDHQREEEYLSVLRAKQVDGLIYLAGTPRPNRALRRWVSDRLPVVIVDEELAGLAAPSVAVDNRLGGRLAAEHLLGLGHRDFAFIGSSPELKTVADRLGGFRERLAEAGRSLDAACTAYGDYRFEGGQRAMETLLGRGASFSALFAANDLMAIGALQVARAHGLRVPADLSVVGFDDIHLSSLITPALTTVAQPVSDLGAVAARLLIDALSSVARGERVILPVHLAKRASTGPPPVVRPGRAAHFRAMEYDRCR